MAKKDRKQELAQLIVRYCVRESLNCLTRMYNCIMCSMQTIGITVTHLCQNNHAALLIP